MTPPSATKTVSLSLAGGAARHPSETANAAVLENRIMSASFHAPTKTDRSLWQNNKDGALAPAQNFNMLFRSFVHFASIPSRPVPSRPVLGGRSSSFRRSVGVAPSPFPGRRNRQLLQQLWRRRRRSFARSLGVTDVSRRNCIRAHFVESSARRGERAMEREERGEERLLERRKRRRERYFMHASRYTTREEN